MRTIAVEEHFLSEAFGEVLRRANLPATPINAKLADLDGARLPDMDANGIDMQLLSHTQSGLALVSGVEEIQLVQRANDELAAIIARHPQRFAGLAILPMQNPVAATTELERAVRTLGMAGGVVHGTTQGRFLDDPAFQPLLARAVDLAVPIYLHPAPPPPAVKQAYYTGFSPDVEFSLATAAWGWHSEVGIHALRMILGGVFDRLPNLQIVIGHMGEMLPFMLARIQNTVGAQAKHLMHPVADYVQQNFAITTSGFFTDPPLQLALQTMGADRILFAVDYPYSTNQQGRTFLDTMSVSPADKAKICHLNAERIFHL